MSKNNNGETLAPAITDAEFSATVLVALAEADRSFAHTGDAMEALGWVALAAKASAPIPANLGRWLHQAITQYRTGQAKSMDEALGLLGEGAANPRRSRLARSALESSLAEMAVFHSLGATIPQAAAMAARLSPGHAPPTLGDRFRRSGMGQRARDDRSLVLRRWSLAEIESLLARIPDRGIEVKQGKAAIRAMYAKTRT